MHPGVTNVEIGKLIFSEFWASIISMVQFPTLFSEFQVNHVPHYVMLVLDWWSKASTFNLNVDNNAN